MIDLEAYRPVCYVCGTASPMVYATQAESEAASVWHAYEQHPDVWMSIIGEAREPDVPKPSPIGVTNPGMN